jgi:predicted 2-oxoglutarate/Fe(II)-dependent dioxygenase YbiX
MVSDPHKREILNDLGSAMTQLISQKGDMKVIRDLEKGRLNLLRMWAAT